MAERMFWVLQVCSPELASQGLREYLQLMFDSRIVEVLRALGENHF